MNALVVAWTRAAIRAEARQQANDDFVFNQFAMAPLMVFNPVPIEAAGDEGAAADEAATAIEELSSAGEVIVGEEAPLQEGIDTIPSAKLDQVLGAFRGSMQAFKTFKPSYLFRYTTEGGKGSWFSPTLYTDPAQARAALALPGKNTAVMTELVKINPTTFLYGIANDMTKADGFGEWATGGGEQVYIADQSAVTSIGVVSQWP